VNAAFFAVDGTLVRGRTIDHFLRCFWRRHRDDPDRAFGRHTAVVRAECARGGAAVRARPYVRPPLAGEPFAELIAAGRLWWDAYRDEPGVFIDATLAATARVATGSCCSRGRRSGPADLGGAHADGRPAEAAAVERTVRALGLDPARCTAYGDHSSDLDMLGVVGHAVVVGTDPMLAAHAGSPGWRGVPARADGTAVAQILTHVPLVGWVSRTSGRRCGSA
jgi:hypothetical protein